MATITTAGRRIMLLSGYRRLSVYGVAVILLVLAVYLMNNMTAISKHIGASLVKFTHKKQSGYWRTLLPDVYSAKNVLRGNSRESMFWAQNTAKLYEESNSFQQPGFDTPELSEELNKENITASQSTADKLDQTVHIFRDTDGSPQEDVHLTKDSEESPAEDLGKLAQNKSESIKQSGPYEGEDTLNAAYWRSPCSTLREQFVGSDPLFPPCRPSVPAGVAKWGKYPYLGPFDFIQESKNPCYYGENKTIHCLPYFYMVGFSKCGTTDLYSRVGQHPQVLQVRKEMQWFSRRRFPEYFYDHSQTFSEYVHHFDKMAFRLRRDLTQYGKSSNIVGDFSPDTINESFEWPQYSGNEGCSEPRVINANLIRHLNSDVKIIVIMRHPVERIYSRFLFDYNRPYITEYRKRIKIKKSLRNPKAFHDFVVDGLRKYRDCFQQFSLRYCIYNRTLWENVNGLKIQDSLYAVLLEDWLRVIPRDQFLFLRSEDYKNDTEKTLETIFEFLELDPVDQERMRRILKTSKRNVGRHNVGPMLPETKKILQEFFRPFIKRLAVLLGDSKFLWNDV